MTPPTGASKLAGLFSLCQLILLNFLALDLLRRLADPLQATTFSHLVVNVAIVGTLGSLLSLLLALLLMGIERIRPALSGPILFFALYSVNLLFAKFQLVPDVTLLDLRLRCAACFVALLLAVPVGLLMRGRLAELRSTVEGGGRALALALSLPFVFLAVLAGVYRLLSEKPPTPQQTVPRMTGRPPNILLITMDALSVNDMSLYGYSLPTTPKLEKWASQFTVFQNAHAASNATHFALPCFQGMPLGAKRSQDELAAQLEKIGYRDTLWISSAAPSFYGVTNLDGMELVYAYESSALYRMLNRVFPRHDLIWLAALGTEEWPYFVPYHPLASAEHHQIWTHDHFLAPSLLKLTVDHMLQQRSAPTFVWTHLSQPHYPYHPQPPFKGRFGSGSLRYPPMTCARYSPGLQDEVDNERRLYDEYILQLDSDLDLMLRRLESTGLLDQTVVVLSADHGESFQDGYVGHGGSRLSEPITHIPLMIRFPGAAPATRPLTFASPFDLLPTLMAYLNVAAPKDLPGENLAPYIANPDKLSQLPRLCVSQKAYTSGNGEIAVYSDHFKVVSTREDRSKVYVYDLRVDPECRTDIAARFGNSARSVIDSIKW